jgi:hypothetical protein
LAIRQVFSLATPRCEQVLVNTNFVTPAKAGVQKIKMLGAGLRRHDELIYVSLVTVAKHC